MESCPGEDVLADDPKGLKVNLMDHQKHALAWMFWREKQKPRGGILADDMGLGKTLTMISLVLACKNRSEEEEDEEKEESASEDDDDDRQKPGWSSKGRKDCKAIDMRWRTLIKKSDINFQITLVAPWWYVLPV